MPARRSTQGLKKFKEPLQNREAPWIVRRLNPIPQASPGIGSAAAFAYQPALLIARAFTALALKLHVRGLACALRAASIKFFGAGLGAGITLFASSVCGSGDHHGGHQE
ncbi:hypothetical protein ABIE13_001709 [Ottowia thiooxydans]|uniref:Uncharacterized protein n=1 Tax=Ottowia thiooxydans TaxID=219182 RepID=A0ABV2Q7F3_9BURK